MKKFVTAILLLISTLLFSACEVSNTELANSLEGNMTRLVYSIGYLDSVSTEDLSNLVNNSSYFTHSSLYTGTAGAEIADTTLDTTMGASGAETLTDTTSSTFQGGLLNETNNTVSGRNTFQNASYRSRTYTSGLENNVTAIDSQNSTVNNVTNSSSAVSTYNAGTVDMSLLETNASDLNDILLAISGKRGVIMLYCTDLRSGRATLSIQDKEAISEYNDIIKETTNYLNNNTGTLTNYFNGISSISTAENSAELINAKLIRANEVLKTRYAKLDTCIDSLDAIINILVNSIGYDYSTLYNANIQNNGANNVTLNPTTNENLATENLTNNLINDAVSNTTTNTEVLDGTASDNMAINENTNTNTTTTNLATPNTNINNDTISSDTSTGANNQTHICPPCLPYHNFPVTLPNNATTYPMANPNNQNVSPNNGDTIINYNYEGNNSSNINTTPNNGNSVLNNNANSSPVTPAVGESVTNTTTQTLTNDNLNNGLSLNGTSTTTTENTTANVTTSELTKTEIALNGGLVKNGNQEKIPAENVGSLIASVSKMAPVKTLEEVDGSTEAVEKLKLARPLEKKEEIKTPPAVRDENPIISLPKDFSEPEITESEKELTPELLPFTGTAPEPNTLEVKPLDINTPELGVVCSLPFVYQEEDVTKKIPRV